MCELGYDCIKNTKPRTRRSIRDGIRASLGVLYQQKNPRAALFQARSNYYAEVTASHHLVYSAGTLTPPRRDAPRALRATPQLLWGI